MTARSPETVVAVDIARCQLPIERPVVIGSTVYRDREYVAVRLRSEDGAEGHAIGYTRGLPLDTMLERLAPRVVGREVGRRASIVEDLRAAHANAALVMQRAIGLLDVALWDVIARRAGSPLWRLLGGARSRVPIMAVGGYNASERTSSSVEEEFRALADRGFTYLKLHGSNPAIATRVTTAIRGEAQLAVDAGMVWRSLPEAVAASRPLDDLDLIFIEDPFPPERWRLTGSLAERLRTPIAAGEDASGPDRLLDLLEVVQVLRIDGTVSGGFGAVLDIAAVAASRGRGVMTHAFPDLHAHLAGSPAVEMIEMIPDETGVNPVGALLARRQVVEGGQIVLSEEPGHGAPLDWAAVERHARTGAHIDAGHRGSDH